MSAPKTYGVILADPEWRLEASSEVSTWRTVKERPVWTFAASDAALFLWAPASMVPQALQIMTCWTFRYRTHVVWAKHRPGTGSWFRDQHELLLVGTRGALPAPAPDAQCPSVIEAPVGRHSEKPEEFLLMIEGYFPDLPKIQLHRRGPPRAGWDAWGTP